MTAAFDDAGADLATASSIFVDVVRLVIIIAGLAVLFSFVWGADVAGLFTASASPPSCSASPCRTPSDRSSPGCCCCSSSRSNWGTGCRRRAPRGRVVEVNWRVVHIDTGNGIQIVPNAALASASFTNLSRLAVVAPSIVSSRDTSI